MMHKIFSIILVSLTALFAQASSTGKSSGSEDIWTLFIFIAIFLFIITGFFTGKGAMGLKEPAGAGNELMKDLDDKYRKGLISKDEYESRKRDLED